MRKIINFETLITAKIIKTLWIVFSALMLATIPLTGIGLFVSGSTCGKYDHGMGTHFCAPGLFEGIGGMIGSIVGVAFLIVITRIIAEFFIIVFSIHDEVKRMGKSEVEKAWGT